jgi:hypothetical protein
MLEVIGFFVLVAIGIMGTIAGYLVFAFSIGAYDIGGKPNTWYNKLFAVVILCGIIGYWYFIYNISPFTLTLHH